MVRIVVATQKKKRGKARKKREAKANLEVVFDVGHVGVEAGLGGGEAEPAGLDVCVGGEAEGGAEGGEHGPEVLGVRGHDVEGEAGAPGGGLVEFAAVVDAVFADGAVDAGVEDLADGDQGKSDENAEGREAVREGPGREIEVSEAAVLEGLVDPEEADDNVDGRVAFLLVAGLFEARAKALEAGRKDPHPRVADPFDRQARHRDRKARRQGPLRRAKRLHEPFFCRREADRIDRSARHKREYESRREKALQWSIHQRRRLRRVQVPIRRFRPPPLLVPGRPAHR
mmetsp:Transcript_5829/g.18385  ORF Transcript_5829/g.18385 Transcript_5829/m.18385 type:complete len:285 (-) Transcript_5829:34-888(-)